MTLPIALDTNLLVRLLVNDDPAQAELAAACIDASAGCFVPITVALELEWVLRGAYKLPRDPKRPIAHPLPTRLPQPQTCR